MELAKIILLIEFINWQLISPFSILLASINRYCSKSNLLNFHYLIQFLIVLPLTVTSFTLEIYSILTNDSSITLYKIVEFIIFSLVLVQIILGHNVIRNKRTQEASTSSVDKESFAPIRKQTSTSNSVTIYFHILIGISLLILGGIQVELGFIVVLLILPFIFYNLYIRLFSTSSISYSADLSTASTIPLYRIPTSEEPIDTTTSNWIGNNRYTNLNTNKDDDENVDTDGGNDFEVVLGVTEEDDDDRLFSEGGRGINQTFESYEPFELKPVVLEELDEEGEEDHSLLPQLSTSTSSSSIPHHVQAINTDLSLLPPQIILTSPTIINDNSSSIPPTTTGNHSVSSKLHTRSKSSTISNNYNSTIPLTLDNLNTIANSPGTNYSRTTSTNYSKRKSLPLPGESSEVGLDSDNDQKKVVVASLIEENNQHHYSNRTNRRSQSESFDSPYQVNSSSSDVLANDSSFKVLERHPSEALVGSGRIELPFPRARSISLGSGGRNGIASRPESQSVVDKGRNRMNIVKEEAAEEMKTEVSLASSNNSTEAGKWFW